MVIKVSVVQEGCNQMEKIIQLLQAPDSPLKQGGIEGSGEDLHISATVHVDGDRFAHTIRIYPGELTHVYVDRHFMAGNETIYVEQVFKNHNELNSGIKKLVTDLRTYLNTHNVNNTFY